LSAESAKPDTRFHQSTSFIGRTTELVELKRLLADPGCRLITILGPGGTGKTRLSLEVASMQADKFEDGVAFIPLQPVTSIEFLVPAMVRELGLTIRGQEDPAQQLFSHIEDKHMLLVFDNFEHIVGAATFISQMLSAARKIKVIASSREALNLSDEWVFPLSGLAFPTGPDDIPEWFDSVRLFVERARRVGRDFDPAAHWQTISRICRLVEGSPLAVELAATWIRTLTPEEIAAEIERSLDFLSTNVRNVPERHRSVRAVFEESWRLLDNDAERRALARLSVFRGSFDRKAAEAVAGATLPVLTGLIEKSLVRPLQDGRYQLHVLVNQFAGEKLAESLEAVDDARDAHAGFYLGILREIGKNVFGTGQLTASEAVTPEMDNIRAAWLHAGDRADVDAIVAATHILGQCCQFKSRYVEGLALMSQAAQELEAADQVPEIEFALANVLVQQAWFQIRLGAIEDAEAATHRSGEIMKRLRMDPVHGFASDYRLPAGIIATIHGNFTEAAILGNEVRQTAERTGDLGNQALALYVLTRAAFSQGNLEEARRYVRSALDVNQKAGDRWFRAYLLQELGNVERASGNIDTARQHYQASFDLREEFGDPEGMAVALSFLGDIALELGTPADATSYYDRALAMYRQIHDKGGLATTLSGAARAAAAAGESDHARKHIREGIAYAAEINHVPQVIALLENLGEIKLAEGNEEQAFPLLSIALHHPASDYEARARVKALGDVAERIEISDVHTAVATLTEALALDDDLGIETLLEEARTEHHPETRQSFPDGLTDREVQVLRLVAAGKSNQQIADELFITANTVANHVKNILSKTQSDNRTEAAAYASSRGLA
jgi:predicted ATPase/DNA-binding NarL/FixJ family response regulator